MIYVVPKGPPEFLLWLQISHQFSVSWMHYSPLIYHQLVASSHLVGVVELLEAEIDRNNCVMRLLEVSRGRVGFVK